MKGGPDAARKTAALTKQYPRTRAIAGIRQHQPCMTRRQFARTAAGTAVLGGALGTGFLKPALAGNWSFAPVPIAGPRWFLPRLWPRFDASRSHRR
jgi:hypothetical protein